MTYIIYNNIINDKLFIFRSTTETLAIIDSLDNKDMTEREVSDLFGWANDYDLIQLTAWQKFRMSLWVFLDQPWSSMAAKVKILKNS